MTALNEVMVTMNTFLLEQQNETAAHQSTHGPEGSRKSPPAARLPHHTRRVSADQNSAMLKATDDSQVQDLQIAGQDQVSPRLREAQHFRQPQDDQYSSSSDNEYNADSGVEADTSRRLSLDGGVREDLPNPNHLRSLQGHPVDNALSNHIHTSPPTSHTRESPFQQNYIQSGNLIYKFKPFTLPSLQTPFK